MFDCSVEQMTKIIFYLMFIGVQLSDNGILLIAAEHYDSSDDNYEANKKKLSSKHPQNFRKLKFYY